MPNYIIGRDIVYFRERADEDIINEEAWRQDPEIAALDPPAGTHIIEMRLSLCTTYDNLHIGLGTIYNREGYKAQIGIRIGNKDYWDQGYGTEAVSLLVRYCFLHMHLGKVWLTVLPTNARAIRCYEKVGFVKTGKIILSNTEFLVMENLGH